MRKKKRKKKRGRREKKNMRERAPIKPERGYCVEEKRMQWLRSGREIVKQRKSRRKLIEVDRNQ